MGSVALPLVGSASAGSLSGRMVRARRRFFGSKNVDSRGRVRRDRVILSWFGCTGFAMAIDGRVVLLDAWVPRGAYSGRVPTSVGELVALAPSHVFIGHGHFDHAADAAPIAAASGATVVGTTAHCAQVMSQAVPHRVRTRALPLQAAGSRDELRVGPRVRVEALRHLHSEPKQVPTGEEPPLVLPPDLSPIAEYPPTPAADTAHLLAHQTDQEGGTVMYRFEVGDFSLVWNDSAGPIRSEASRVCEILRKQRRASVQIGAIQGFGQYTNGIRDPLDYVRAIRPIIFVPSHHDNWCPPVSTSADYYERPLRGALDNLPVRTRPVLRFIRDTEDYVNPRRLTFHIR